MRKTKIALVGCVAVVIAVFSCVSVFAAGIRVVPSTQRVLPGEDFFLDILTEGIPAEGLGGIQFRLNVVIPSGIVTGVADLGQADRNEVAVASPLLVSPSTLTRSGIGDFFRNGTGPNGILIMDNEPLVKGSALYTFAHTSGSTPPTGSGSVARFMFRVGSEVKAKEINIGLTDVMLLDGGPVYPLDYNAGATMQIGCFTRMPDLAGLSLVEATARLTQAQLILGTIYEVNNPSGTRLLNVVLEQSSPPGSEVLCEAPVNVAVNVAPSEVTGGFAVDKPGDDTGAVLLSWAPSTSGDVAGYRVYLPSNAFKDIGNASAAGTEVGGLPNGATSQLRVTSYDTFGNESHGITIAATPIDDVPPIVTIVSPQPGLTNNNRPLFAYYTTKGVAVTKLDGAVIAAASNSNLGPLADGAHLLRVEAANAAGYSGFAERTFTIDTLAPELLLSMLPDKSYTNNGTLNIAGTVTDAAGIQEITVNGTPVPVSTDGTFSQAIALTAGANTVATVATDMAGNTTTDIRTINLDLTAPLLAVIAPADNSKTANALIDVSGTMDEASTVTVKVKDTIQNAVVTGTSFTATVALEAGINTLEITATDLAGNPNTQKRTVLFDDHTPSLAVNEPNQDARMKQANLTIRGTVSDPYTAVVVCITMDGTTFTPPIVNGAFEQAVVFTAEKTYGIIVTATNEVGTTTTVQRNIIYDATPPAFTIDPVVSPTNELNQRISGTRETGATVAVACSTATVADVVYPSDVSWVATISELRSDANDISVTAVDAAGNIAAATARIIYDTTPPAGSIVINNGAVVTQSSFVQLTLNVSDTNGVSQMRFSPDGTSWTDLEATAAMRGWSLTSGDGLKQVCAQFMDVAGNWSQANCASIILDTTPPAVFATPAAGIYNVAQSVTLAANEPATIYYTTDNSIPTVASLVYSQPIAVSSNTTLKYFAKDPAGNSGAVKTEPYVIDKVPPTMSISTLADGSYTNKDALNIAGTVTDNTGVQGIAVNNTEVAVNPDSSFSYALILHNGPNDIMIVATDSAGNIITDKRTINLDMTAPLLAVTAPADNSKTASPQVTATGTVDETSTVFVKLGSEAQIAALDGTAFSAFITLAPGTNTIEFTATDLASNKSSDKRTVLYDDQSPSLAITVPVQDIRTNEASLRIAGTTSDPYGVAVTVSISINGQTFTPQVINGQFEQVVKFTAEKSYPIVVTATNEVGTATTIQRNIIYDTTKPILTINPLTSPTNKLSQPIGGAREEGAPVSVICATATVGVVEYPTVTSWKVSLSNLSEGDNRINVISTDAAGNEMVKAAVITVVTRAPEFTLDAQPNVLWPISHKDVPVTVIGGLSDGRSDIRSVIISISDEYGAYSQADLTFGSIVMLEAWRDGNDMDGRIYTITATVTDTAGNATTKSTKVVVPHDQAQKK